MRTASLLLPAVLLPSVLLPACSSVDQVPLVYVSTHKLGVSASSGTAESPGAKVVIGFESTDAAYVPVAVARVCGSGSAAAGVARNCNGVDYPVEPIRGGNALSSEERNAVARERTAAIAAAQGRLDSAVAELRRSGQEEAKALVALDRLAEDERNVIAFDTAQAAAPGVGADGLPLVRPAEPEEIRAARRRLALLPVARSQMEASRRDHAIALEGVATGTEEVKGLQAGLAALVSSDPKAGMTRNDALSVFGSFDGAVRTGVGAGETGAGLNLGKSFATGVAAQELTDGIKAAAVKSASAQAGCLGKLNEAVQGLPAAAQPAAMMEGLKVCQGLPPTP